MFLSEPGNLLGFLIVILASFLIGGLIGRQTTKKQIITKEVRVEVPIEGPPSLPSTPKATVDDNSFSNQMNKALLHKQETVKKGFEEDVQKMIANNKISDISARKAYDNLPVTVVRQIVQKSVTEFNKSSQHYVLSASVTNSSGYNGYIARINLGSR